MTDLEIRNEALKYPSDWGKCLNVPGVHYSDIKRDW